MPKSHLPYVVRHPVRGVRALVSDPMEAMTTLYERAVERREHRRPPSAYQTDPEWERRLHELIGIAWPCEVGAEFWRLWAVVNDELRAKGLRVGPESFAAWNDGDAGLVRAAWCVARHLRPQVLLETGVAHGVTTRFLLEALELNGGGHLWSIDLPPQLYPELHGEIGAAVDRRLTNRWSYVRGSSRRKLRGVLERLGPVDLFIHDSLHSERNVRFELEHVWQALRPGGIVLVDDIDANRGFSAFTRTIPGPEVLICEGEPLAPDRRRTNAKGVFGIIRKAGSERS
jgi:hypothetical protein